MAFCPSCGAEVQGNFCAKCGAQVGGSSAPPPPPSAAQAGITDNVASALCYLLSILTGILFLVLEPYNKNKTIRFHAFQSIFLWVAVVVLYIVAGILSVALGALPFIGFLFSVVLWAALGLGCLFLWLMLMYKAYNGEKWVLPVVGPLAEKQA
jgi:uncharacterized membrane protein